MRTEKNKFRKAAAAVWRLLWQTGRQCGVYCGMCGLDDGGLLHRMEEYFNDSLGRANKWAKEVIPKLGAKEKSDIAILFPSAMAAYEFIPHVPVEQKNNELYPVDEKLLLPHSAVFVRYDNHEI